MRFLAFPFVVSAILLSACSTPSTAPEDLAKSYIQSIVNNDKSLMSKVLQPSEMNSQHWDIYVNQFKALQDGPAKGTAKYTLKKCWRPDDGKTTFCQFSLDSTTQHIWSMYVQVKDGATKVDSAAVGQ